MRSNKRSAANGSVRKKKTFLNLQWLTLLCICRFLSKLFLPVYVKLCKLLRLLPLNLCLPFSFTTLLPHSAKAANAVWMSVLALGVECARRDETAQGQFGNRIYV
jgi:hypothetical protein